MDFTNPLFLLSGAVASLSGVVAFLFQSGKKEREKIDQLFREDRNSLLESFVKERAEILQGWEREKTELRLSQELQSSQLLIISKEIYQKLGEMTTLLSAVFERRHEIREKKKSA